MKLLGGQILDNVDEFVHKYLDHKLFPSRTEFNGDKNKVHEAMMKDEIYSKLNKKERTEAMKILDKLDKNIDRVGRKETKMALKEIAKEKQHEKVKTFMEAHPKQFLPDKIDHRSYIKTLNSVKKAMMEDKVYSVLNEQERDEAVRIMIEDQRLKVIADYEKKEKAKDLPKEELIDVIHKAKCKMLKGLDLESMTKGDIIKHLEKVKCPELAKLTEEVYSLEQTVVVSNVWDIKPTKEQLKKWKSKIKVDKHGNHYIYVGKFDTETGTDDLGGFKLHPKKFEKFDIGKGKATKNIEEILLYADEYRNEGYSDLTESKFLGAGHSKEDWKALIKKAVNRQIKLPMYRGTDESDVKPLLMLEKIV
jgi:hypothetical protein